MSPFPYQEHLPVKRSENVESNRQEEAKLIQFAIDEPELYRIHFMSQGDMSTTDYLKERMEMEKILPFISSSLELNDQDAKWLFTNMVFYALGMGTLLANNSCIMSDAEINRNLGSVCRGLMMQLKAAKDERVEIIPDENVKDLGKLEEYRVSIKKSLSVMPTSGGRGRLQMVNGETVIASRTYYKDITDALKDPAI